MKYGLLIAAVIFAAFALTPGEAFGHPRSVVTGYSLEGRVYTTKRTCERARERSQLTGTVVGGTVGAVVGSQVSRNERSLGTGIGAVAGAVVGNRMSDGSKSCEPIYRRVRHSHK